MGVVIMKQTDYGERKIKTEQFWNEFQKLDEKFGTNEFKMCKKHGFVTHLKDWRYCPYCGEEFCGNYE